MPYIIIVQKVISVIQIQAIYIHKQLYVILLYNGIGNILVGVLEFLAFM